MAKKKSKKYLEAAKKVEADKAYTANEAVALVKEIDFANFDATVEVAFNLNLDTKQADQQLRGALVLPNGTGKEQTVVVFAKGPNGCIHQNPYVVGASSGKYNLDVIAD